MWFIQVVQQKSYAVEFIITKTYLYNFDPLKHHFYTGKLGFTGVNIIFLIFARKHRLWVLVRTASARRFERVPTIYVLSRYMKNIRIFYLKIFLFLVVKFSIYLNKRVFVMDLEIKTGHLIVGMVGWAVSQDIILESTTCQCCVVLLRYRRHSLSRSSRDSQKYFEISAPRHIRFAELRKKINRATKFHKWIRNITH